MAGNSNKTRGKGRPFEPGKSGNPLGRPKEHPEVRELAQLHTVEAIERLAYWMRSKNPRASVAAANSMLDRGHGKALQRNELTGKGGEKLEVQVRFVKSKKP